jgi:hypothetical protein
MRRYFILFFTLLCLLIGAALSYAATNVGIDVVTNYERAHPTQLKYELDPGQVFEDSIRISNRNDYEIWLELTSVDRVFINDDFFFRDINDEQTGVGSWIELSETIFPVPAYDTIDIPYTLTIPETAAPGDYQGGLILSDAVGDYGDEVEAEISTGGAGTVILTQSGKSISVSVTGEVNFDFGWIGQSRIKDESREGEVFELVFENNGNAAVDIGLTMDFKNFFFWEVGQIIPVLSPVYAGAETTVDVQWEEPPLFGLITLKSTLNYSRSNFGGNLTEEDIAADSGTLEKTMLFLIIPWLEVLITFFVFLGALGFFLWRAKKFEAFVKSLKAKKMTKTESLTVLAANCGANWKLLAKANKIKSPYLVQKGQTVLLPKK